jgi:copper chaperone CopZ
MNTSISTDVGKRFTCPRCGEEGKPVKPITLQSLLKPDPLTRVGAIPYRFCGSEHCDIVYFPEPGGAAFTKEELAIRVGIKETTPPRHVCYCFNHTIEEIEGEVRRTGKTTVLDSIKTRMKEACWCETKSPLGSCCLATVSEYVKQSLERHSPGVVGAAVTEKQEDCAAGAMAAGPGESYEDCCATHQAKPDARSAPSPPVEARVSKGEKIAWIGSIGSAVVASACCWLPLALLAFGVSGVAVSATFEKYRPFFAALTFGFLAAAFCFAYRPKPKTVAASSAASDACCTTAAVMGDCCPEGNTKWTLQRFNRGMLWVVAVIALAFVLFPNYVGALLGGGKNTDFGANLERYVVAVDGMGCAACATGLEKQLRAIPGVNAVRVSYEKQEAVIGVRKGGAAPTDAVLAAISGSGFKGRFQSLETRTMPISGMTCQACAARVQASLAKVPGVRSATVRYGEQKAVVVANSSVDQTALFKAVEFCWI